MAELKQLEFFLVRYVPHLLKEEFVNFGLIMYEPAAIGSGFLDARITNDWRPLLELDPQADIEYLDAMGRDIRREMRDPGNCGPFLRRLEESLSNLVQLSPKQVYLSANPAKEIDELARLYFSKPKPEIHRETPARQKIYMRMSSEFERRGLSSLVDELPRAIKGKYGFQFDFGYAVGQAAKLFHAVSLKSNMDHAVRIIAKYPTIARDLEKEMQMRSFLTAVVDDDFDKSRDEVQFVLNSFKQNSIAVVPVSDMPRQADIAKRELRA